MYLDLSVEMMQLKRVFVVMRSSVGVLVTPGLLISYPPTVNLTQWVSCFLNLMFHTAWQYVDLQHCSISCNLMKKHVFVPLCHFKTCDSRPSLLEIMLFQTSLLSQIMRFWYSIILPTSFHIAWFVLGRIITKSVFWV